MFLYDRDDGSSDSVVTAAAIRNWTVIDLVLSMVRRMVLHGWQPQAVMTLDHMSNICLNFVSRMAWSSRVVVPPQGRQHVLEILHEGHPGISRMKSLARGIAWRPKLDADQETLVSVTGHLV